MPGDAAFEAVPRDVFGLLADLLPMNELLSLRETSTAMRRQVADYVEREVRAGRILDAEQGFNPILGTAEVETVIKGLAGRTLARELNQVGRAEVIKRWDDSVRAAVHADPFSPDVDMIRATVDAFDQTWDPGNAPPDIARRLDEGLRLRQDLHTYVEYCLGNDLLVRGAGDRPVDPATTADDAIQWWYKGDIHYDRGKVK